MPKNITIDAWAEKVKSEEIAIALSMVKNGVDPNLVLEAMAEKIKNKILHYFLLDIKNSIHYNVDVSKQEYEDTYLKKVQPKYDHISDD